MTEVPNNEQRENEQEQVAAHTAMEVELRRQLDVIRAENEQLKQTNAQLFRLAMGSNPENALSPIQKKLQRFFDSHFNLAELSKGE